MLRHDDAAGARSLRAPADRAEVVRIGDAVEADEERPLTAGELPGVGVRVRLAEGDDSLVVPGARRRGQRSLGAYLDTQARSLLQPRLRGERALRDEQLERLAPPGADYLAHRVAAVDELAGRGHRRIATR